MGGSFDMPVLEILCECGDIDCSERFEIAHHSYEELRSDATLFAVLPSHEIPDVEDVVEANDPYLVVRKHAGDPARAAEATDPR